MDENTMTTLETAREKLVKILREHNLLDEPVEVLARFLTPEEAIGTPGRRDFPIVRGKEKMLEATIRGARGQSFTDSRREFVGTVAQVLALPLDSSANRAIFVATLNAALRYLGLVEGTVHCKNDEPERCAHQIADFIAEKFAPKRVGLIGLNPAIAEALAEKFGAENLTISDLDPDNIGQKRFGTKILDGATQTAELVANSDFVLMTGTTIVNGTFDQILSEIRRAPHNPQYLTYGVTIAGVSYLMGIPKICPFGK
ncbi:hypothetical protein J7K99_08240 [bacterium]|nr:hypothetical protein [bacterium]